MAAGYQTADVLSIKVQCPLFSPGTGAVLTERGIQPLSDTQIRHIKELRGKVSRLGDAEKNLIIAAASENKKIIAIACQDGRNVCVKCQPWADKLEIALLSPRQLR
jgi:hypothetical protein